MQRQSMRKRLSFLVLYSVLSVFVTLTSETLIAVASQTLPPGVIIGDETGISASSKGDYFVDLPNVLPGESYEKTITIRGMDVKEPFELGVLAKPESTKGVIEFGKQIKLTLSIDGKKLYQGPLLGNGEFDWTIEPLILGTCEYGKDQILTALFEVDKNLTSEDYKEESQLVYHWTFIATKNQTKSSETNDSDSSSAKVKPKGKFPMTGEEIRNMMYKILSGLLLVLIAILLWKKHKEQQGEVD